MMALLRAFDRLEAQIQMPACAALTVIELTAGKAGTFLTQEAQVISHPSCADM
jgi:hypothetical protein